MSDQRSNPLSKRVVFNPTNNVITLNISSCGLITRSRNGVIEWLKYRTLNIDVGRVVFDRPLSSAEDGITEVTLISDISIVSSLRVAMSCMWALFKGSLSCHIPREEMVMVMKGTMMMVKTIKKRKMIIKKKNAMVQKK